MLKPRSLLLALVLAALIASAFGTAASARRSVVPRSGAWSDPAYRDEDRYTPGVESNFDVDFDIGTEANDPKHPHRLRVIVGDDSTDPDTGHVIRGMAQEGTIRVAGVCSYRQVYYFDTIHLRDSLVVRKGRFHVKNKRLDLSVRFTSRTRAVANVRIKFVGFGESCVQSHTIHLNWDSPYPAA